MSAAVIGVGALALIMLVTFTAMLARFATLRAELDTTRHDFEECKKRLVRTEMRYLFDRAFAGTSELVIDTDTAYDRRYRIVKFGDGDRAIGRVTLESHHFNGNPITERMEFPGIAARGNTVSVSWRPPEQ